MLGLTDPTIFYENLKQRLAERIPAYVDCIEQLGLLDETPVVKLNTPLDTLSAYLSKRLAFGKKLLKYKILRDICCFGVKTKRPKRNEKTCRK